jgi:hypothetical protein
MTIEQLMGRIQDIENQFSDIKNQRDPNGVHGNLAYLQGAIESLAVKISDIENFIEEFNTADKFIETFTKDEIKSLYNRSGLSMPDVQGFLCKLTGSSIGMEEASDVINGHEFDVRLVSRVGKYLRSKAIKNAR